MNKKLLNKNLDTINIAVRVFLFPLLVFALLMKLYDKFFKAKIIPNNKRLLNDDMWKNASKIDIIILEAFFILQLYLLFL